MSLAKKLKEVVAANFIEIARVDTPAQPETPGDEVRRDGVPPASALAPETLQGVSDIDLDAAAEAGRRTAEAELDGLLTPLPTSNPFELPIPVLEPAPPPAPPLERLLDAVDGEGHVDFDRIYRHHGMKSAPFTAEQAMNMLTSMPRDLPLRVKRVTVRATLDAIGQVVGATPKDIVADATAKREHLESYLSEMEAEAEEETARLQAEITALQAALKETQKKRSNARDAARVRLETLEQVQVFFDYDESAETAEAPAAAEDGDGEVPAFMQEDSVLRMLGLANGEDESGAVAGNSAPSPSTNGAKDSRSA